MVAQDAQKAVVLPPILSVKDLAESLDVAVTEVIGALMKNGVMATINEDIDYETAAIVAADFDIETTPQQTEKVEESVDVITEDPKAIPRPPVVTVLGHVDHGKTSLLDAIRKTNVVAGESGGITQHIGAYQIAVKPKGAKEERKITFLDTPGHEAFTAMRAHGTKITDIAILVVAADDGVKPQTVEAIQHIKAAGVPYLVAVTKMDVEGADLNRVKQELAEKDVISDDWGGQIVFAPVSSKSGDGISDLLDMLLLISDMADPKANPKADFEGVVIESRLSRAKGSVATVLVRNGTLAVGDYVVLDDVTGRVRLMEGDTGARLEQALPGTPVLIAGLSGVPAFGARVTRVVDDKTARAAADLNIRRSRARKISKTSVSAEAIKRAVDKGKIKQLPIVLVADVKGSLEAIEHSLAKIPQDEVAVQIVSTGVGSVSESDIRQASSSGAMIVSFRARLEATAKSVAKQLEVQISTYEVIYELLDDIKSALESLLPPEIVVNTVGQGEVLAIFRTTKTSQIIGCKVLEKKFVPGVEYRNERTEETGKVTSLRRVDEVVQEVSAGTECGLTIEGPHVEVGDTLTLFRTTEKRRVLA